MKKSKNKLQDVSLSQKNKERFNEWMLKLKSTYYHDNEQMLNAFNKIK
jgi:hypothetical protein